MARRLAEQRLMSGEGVGAAQGPACMSASMRTAVHTPAVAAAAYDEAPWSTSDQQQHRASMHALNPGLHKLQPCFDGRHLSRRRRSDTSSLFVEITHHARIGWRRWGWRGEYGCCGAGRLLRLARLSESARLLSNTDTERIGVGLRTRERHVQRPPARHMSVQGPLRRIRALNGKQSAVVRDGRLIRLMNCDSRKC